MGAYNRLSEKTLTTMLMLGDRDAFTEVYNHYWSLLYLHARRLITDEEQARDIVQEVFTNLWNNREQLDESTNLNAFLYKSVRNKILNKIRDEKVRDRYIDDLGQFYEEGYAETDELVRFNELKKLIEGEIQLLPAKMREIFELSRNEHLSHAEIAERLGVSSETVKKQIYKALKVLKVKFKMPMSVLLMLLNM